MKRRYEHEPAPNTIVFEDIPNDIWFVVLSALSSLRDIWRMGSVCHGFNEMATRRVQKLSIFDSMSARYIRDNEDYLPIKKVKLLRQKWRPCDTTPFPRALVIFVCNFMDTQTSLTFFIWGDQYELVNLYSRDGSMSGKHFIIHRRKGEKHDGCFCEKYINPFLRELLKNLFKDQLCQGVGSKNRFDIYNRISAVVLLIRLLDKLQCSFCYELETFMDTTSYKVISNSEKYKDEKGVKVPLCIMNPNSKTHMYI